MTRVSYIPVKGIKPNRGKQVTVAEFRRMWEDPTITMADIADRLGICQRSVWQRAKYRGLGPRGYIVSKARCVFDDEFPAMFEARVTSEEIARHYGCTISNVEKHSRRIKVKRSRRITRWDAGISLAGFRDLQLREAMAESARREQAALRLAKMVDGRRAVPQRAA